MKIEGKTAIITSGGGMKCAYAGGALVALAKALDIKNPDVFVAASGSVGGMFYYLAEQYDDIQKAWTRYLPSSHFIRYWPIPAMRINYLIDTVMRDYIPICVDRLETAPTKWFVPITDVETGDNRFVTNDLWFSPYEVMRAATAIPILYNSHVRLGARSYLDGDFSTNLMSLVEKAIAEGATRILCITNTTPPTKFGKLLIRAYARFLNPALRGSVLNDLVSRQDISWPEGIEFVSISPSFELPAVLYSRERRKIIQTFNMGYDDLLAKKEEIRALFR